MNATRALRRAGAPGSMLRRFPWGPIGEDFDHMLTRMFGQPMSEWMVKEPEVDVAETEKEIEVRMDAPGFKPEQIDVQLDGDALTVKGHREEEERREENGKKYHVVERRTGSFTRIIPLPAAVDPNQIEAKLVEGVLNVRLAKTANPTAKRIPVTA